METVEPTFWLWIVQNKEFLVSLATLIGLGIYAYFSYLLAKEPRIPLASFSLKQEFPLIDNIPENRIDQVKIELLIRT